MSSRSNPFEEIERLFDRMSRQFDEASRTWESEGPLGRFASGGEPASVDLVERDDEFVATVDLPGFEREDVDIRLTNRSLRIRADRDVEREKEEGRFVRRERRQHSVERSIRLPDEVDTEGAGAEMRNGVLTVTLPKVESEEARSIDIE